jgi:hypothetical protein
MVRRRGAGGPRGAGARAPGPPGPPPPPQGLSQKRTPTLPTTVRPELGTARVENADE